MVPTRFLLAAIVLLGLISARLAAQEGFGTPITDLATAIEECEKSVVRIEVQVSPNGPADEGVGSGFVIDRAGIIATNWHVLENASAAKAIFKGGESVAILGTLVIDRERDICIAKIDAKDLTTVKLAADVPRKGSQVAALGCPVGFSFTATVGVVSAIRSEQEMRKELGTNDFRGTWIQVDAALSPGNSGGPLISESGEVVAMATLASVGVAQNLNFGISAGDVLKVAANASNQQLVRLTPSGTKRSLIAGLPRMTPRDTSRDVSPEMRGVMPRLPGGLPRLPSGLPRIPGLDGDLNMDMTHGRHFSIQMPPPPNAKTEPFTNRRPADLNDPAQLKAYVKTGRSLYLTLKKELDAKLRTRDAERRRIQDEAENNSGSSAQMAEFQARLRRERLVELTKEVDELKALRDSLSTKITTDSLWTLLNTLGPPASDQTLHSIGHLGRCRVLGVMSDDALFVDTEHLDWALVWVQTTKDQVVGEYIDLGPVQYMGNEACALPPGASTNVPEFPVFLIVDEYKLKEAVFGPGESQAKDSGDEYRTWKDASGQFSVEAVFVEIQGDDVHLRRRDGALLKVPKSKLSAADQQALPQR